MMSMRAARQLSSSITNQNINIVDGDEMLRFLLVGYDRMRSSPELLGLTEEEFNNARSPKTRILPAACCPPVLDFANNRKSILNNTRVLCNHKGDKEDPRFGIVIDMHFKPSEENLERTNLLFTVGVYKSLVPDLLRKLDAPEELVDIASTWEVSNYTLQGFDSLTRVKEERKVIDWFQNNVQTSIQYSYLPVVGYNLEGGAPDDDKIYCTDFDLIEVSLTRNPRYEACIMLVANTAPKPELFNLVTQGSRVRQYGPSVTSKTIRAYRLKIRNSHMSLATENGTSESEYKTTSKTTTTTSHTPSSTTVTETRSSKSADTYSNGDALGTLNTAPGGDAAAPPAPPAPPAGASLQTLLTSNGLGISETEQAANLEFARLTGLATDRDTVENFHKSELAIRIAHGTLSRERKRMENHMKKATTTLSEDTAATVQCFKNAFQRDPDATLTASFENLAMRVENAEMCTLVKHLVRNSHAREAAEQVAKAKAEAEAATQKETSGRETAKNSRKRSRDEDEGDEEEEEEEATGKKVNVRHVPKRRKIEKNSFLAKNRQFIRQPTQQITRMAKAANSMIGSYRSRQANAMRDMYLAQGKRQ